MARTAEPSKKEHTHVEVRSYVLGTRGGVPYEVERTVCSACGRVIAERPLRRTAA